MYLSGEVLDLAVDQLPQCKRQLPLASGTSPTQGRGTAVVFKRDGKAPILEIADFSLTVDLFTATSHFLKNLALIISPAPFGNMSMKPCTAR